MPPSPKPRRCAFKEGGRRCPRYGEGTPPLCNACRVALAATAAPRSPAQVIADSLQNFLSGRAINVDQTMGAVESLVGQWAGMGANYRPEVQEGESEDSSHRRAQSGAARPSWFPGAQAQAPQPDPDAQARIAARRVMGFGDREPLTANEINDRKRKLARKYHPDLGGGSPRRIEQLTRKMAEVNAAADVLLEAL